MSYHCPHCQGTNLGLMVMTSATVVQHPGGAVETTVDNTDEHEWDDLHNMWCKDCQHCDAAGSFWKD